MPTQNNNEGNGTFFRATNVRLDTYTITSTGACIEIPTPSMDE